jgi:hypothetical protein
MLHHEFVVPRRKIRHHTPSDYIMARFLTLVAALAVIAFAAPSNAQDIVVGNPQSPATPAVTNAADINVNTDDPASAVAVGAAVVGAAALLMW